MEGIRLPSWSTEVIDGTMRNLKSMMYSKSAENTLQNREKDSPQCTVCLNEVQFHLYLPSFALHERPVIYSNKMETEAFKLKDLLKLLFLH